MVQWGKSGIIGIDGADDSMKFMGQIIEMEPSLDNEKSNLYFTHLIKMPDGKTCKMSDVSFFSGEPALAYINSEIFLLRNSPASEILGSWASKEKAPVSKLTHRLLTNLRKIKSTKGLNWEQLCDTHKATPKFVFEMADETVNLKLRAISETDKSILEWSGHEWMREKEKKKNSKKPEVLDDLRLEAAVEWLKRLD